MSITNQFDFSKINCRGLYQGDVFDYFDIVSCCFNMLKINGAWNLGLWNQDQKFTFSRLVKLLEQGVKIKNEGVRYKYVFLAKKINLFLKEIFDEHPNCDLHMFGKKIRLY